MTPLSESARAKIEEARQKQMSYLSLWGEGLEEFPEEILSLSNLETLELGRNRITSIPDGIKRLSNLRSLGLRSNPLKIVPDVPGLDLDWRTFLRSRSLLSLGNITGIGVSLGESQEDLIQIEEEAQLLNLLAELPKLDELHIGFDSVLGEKPLHQPTGMFADFVRNVGSLDHLRSLDFFGVSLFTPPPSIRKLKGLHRLSLSCCALEGLPAWISELKNLTDLNLYSNNLDRLPAEVASLPNLDYIDLSNNHFTEIPDILFTIPSLRRLRMRGDDTVSAVIKEVPKEILKSGLVEIELYKQPIETPPPEVVAKGVEAIRNYWRQQQEVGVDYLCEAKLLVIGEAGAGKTSLARKILDPSYELKPTEISTEGIEITRWTFRSANRCCLPSTR
jgi:internalin A